MSKRARPPAPAPEPQPEPPTVPSPPCGLCLRRAVVLAVVLRVCFGLIVVMVGRIGVRDMSPFWDMVAHTVTRWDAVNYLRIASQGSYDVLHNRGGDLTFFPLYPLFLSRLLFLGFLPAYGLLSFVCQVAAGYLLQRLLAFDHDPEQCQRALYCFYLFPTAVFLMVPYTEAMFMTTVLGTLVAARSGDWPAAGGWSAAAALCRSVGIGVWLALLWEGWHSAARRRAIGWSMLGPVGFLGYLALNAVCTGTPFYFLWVQKHLFEFSLEAPWQTLYEQMRGIVLTGPSDNVWSVGIPHEVGQIATYLVLFWLWRARVRPSYQIFCWFALLPATLSLFSPSLPRYLLPAFPMYALMAARAERFPLLLVAGTLLMGALSVCYAAGYWSF